MRAYGSIPGIENAAKKAILGLGALRFIASNMDDLSKHGVKFTVYLTCETQANVYVVKEKTMGQDNCFLI